MATRNIEDELRAAISDGSAGSGTIPILSRVAEVVAIRPAEDAASGESRGDGLSSLTAQLAGLREAQEVQTRAVTENTRATLESVARSARGALAAAGNAVIDGGLPGTGLTALAGGILRMLSRGSSESAEALPLLLAPAPIHIEAALPTGEISNFAEIVRDQSGVARRVTEQPAAAPAVTIQVNAMDSRSFLDHSDEIARAVKHALLNSHSLRDVVGEF